MGSRILEAFPGLETASSEMQVQPTANPQFGDFQWNAAMKLAPRVKKNPREVAKALVGSVPPPEGVAKVDIAGPGFINFYLDDTALAQQLMAMGQDDRLGVPKPGQGHRVIMDYSSPNVAKPMHIGHIRSTVIGNALDRLHRFMGYDVIADNHVGDWGTQFGIIIMGYRHFLDKEALKNAPVEELERVYRVSYERSKTDESWLDQARAELVKLQSGDPENLALWEEFIRLSKQEFDRTFQRLGVSFDLERGESWYRDRLAGVIALLKEKGLYEESEGAGVVKLDAEGLPLSIVQKSDGGFNYTTTDLATVISRVEEFNPDRIIYVTDERQQLHFKQFFAIAAKLGFKVKLEHVWFGLMRLPDATFSTREGNVIKLERLLDEAVSRAFEMVRASTPEMPEADQRKVAEAVGIGAVKYADLSQNPQSLVTFTWEKALSLEGNSAPYLQYAYARIASVRDKYRDQFPGKNFMDYPIVLGEEVERRLAILLTRFGDVLQSATSACRPNYLADYLYDLSQTYSAFYQNVPFLKAEEGVRESRIRLCDLVARTLRTGLGLLGISTPDRI
ncbi:MAG: arginine--tRNA ligase [Kiritimatiellia bacterium]